MASIDPSMAFSSGNDVARAISLNPNLAAKAVGQVDAGGVPSLGGADSGMSLSGVGKHTPEEMRKVAQQFEAIFLRMLMQQIAHSVEKKHDLWAIPAPWRWFNPCRETSLPTSWPRRAIGLGDSVYGRDGASGGRTTYGSVRRDLLWLTYGPVLERGSRESCQLPPSGMFFAQPSPRWSLPRS
jgi:hypothetical protein